MLHLAGTLVPETKVQNDGKVKPAPAKTRALVKVNEGTPDGWHVLHTSSTIMIAPVLVYTTKMYCTGSGSRLVDARREDNSCLSRL
jgi:hypothetical protein